VSAFSEIDEPEWPEILRAVQTNLQDRIHTALPAIVRAYDSTTQTAQVQLAVQLLGQNVPPLHDVPVCWPGGAQGFIHAPLAAGDSVLVIFTENDFSGWYDTGSVSAPRVLARHGLHAVAIPGLRRAAAPLAVTAGHVTVGAASELRLGSDEAIDYVALEPGVVGILLDVITEVSTVIAALVPVTGVATGVQATFVTNMAAIVARVVAGEMAATKVKAE
jgi:hypothetical protein